jgi:TolB-like protein/class 3 adenylate cyclase/cytochrome c-type biogenesis protein CcmH/NrfG
MTTEDLTRRLSAILSADVEGYSLLMREDEQATVHTLTTYRTAMTHLINQYRGRVVDSPGDNILAEFTSVVDAVNCGVEIQRELAERNAELPENRRMQLRIGINLGDVLEEGERIYGDGVNIAARMESLAEAGEICISGTVYDAIEAKIGLEYEYLGEKEVKNIDKPVRAYRVLSLPGAAAHRVVKAKRAVQKTWRNVVVAIVAVLLVGVAFAVWHFYLRPSPPSVEIASEERMALPLPDKPSIAVLPFENLSGEPEQEYFSDGMTEDLITDLSRLSGLFVIARNSSFRYKGQTIDPQQISRELGVRYVLEGSVRRADDRVRINAQLIDATTGYHVWADRYDRELGDIFSLQDDITKAIVASLEVELAEGSQQQPARRYTDNVEAYDLFLWAREHQLLRTRQGLAEAKQALERAIDLDPAFAGTYAVLSDNYFLEWIFQWSEDPNVLDHALELAQKAVALDASLPLAQIRLAWIYLWKKQYDQAIAGAKKAVALDPNYADGYARLGTMLNYAGRPEEGIKFIKKAMRLDPRYPFLYLFFLAQTYEGMERYEEAIATFKRALARNPKHLGTHYQLASIYGHLGRMDEARAEAAEILRLNPDFSVKVASQRWAFKDPARLRRIVEGMRKAGLK